MVMFHSPINKSNHDCHSRHRSSIEFGQSRDEKSNYHYLYGHDELDEIECEREMAQYREEEEKYEAKQKVDKTEIFSR